LGLLAASSLVIAAGVAASPAHAISVCGGSGTIFTFPNTGPTPSSVAGPFRWQIEGSGACQARFLTSSGQFLDEPQKVTLHGSGTSDTLGLCSGTLLVTNLDLTMKVTYVGTVTGTTFKVTESWFAPITTFPIVTPYFMSANDRFGGGIMFHHLILTCGNGGTNPSLSFDWIEQAP
jgi:hypothetical protein